MSTLKKSGMIVVVSMVLLLGVGLVWEMLPSGCKWDIGSGVVSVSCKERYPDIAIKDIQISSDNNNPVLQQGERMYIYLRVRLGMWHGLTRRPGRPNGSRLTHLLL